MHSATAFAILALCTAFANALPQVKNPRHDELAQKPDLTQVPSFCKGASFPAVFPPTPAQLCCEGYAESCKEIPHKRAEEKPKVPEWCAHTAFLMVIPKTAAQLCCEGDQESCEGLPEKREDMENPPADIPAWCKDKVFIQIVPPTPEEQCCKGHKESCKGLPPN